MSEGADDAFHFCYEDAGRAQQDEPEAKERDLTPFHSSIE